MRADSLTRISSEHANRSGVGLLVKGVMAPPGFVDKRNVSRRPIALLPVVLLLIGTAAASVGSAADDPTYEADNARLAHATPAYPSARLLVDEPIWGEAGSTPFEAVQRIYRLAAPSTQGRIIRFYGRRLGHSWRPRGKACLVSGRRTVVAYFYARRRRLGIVIDSRGAAHCAEHVANIAQLLELGYPD
jgi:hypothetical protein